MKKLEPRYWDSDCFLTWLKGEKEKRATCQGVIEHAEAGKILIVTSALTLAEVIRLKGKPRIPKEDAAKIEAFFKQPFIDVRNVDRQVAELAREFMWKYKSLKHKVTVRREE
ncbi:MAG: PIN domain-containing protein [Desulfomonilaceae bacterium]